MRCKGTTKAGARCKRQVAEGVEYCTSHAFQASEESPAEPLAADSFRSEEQSEPPEAEGPNVDGQPNDEPKARADDQDWIDVAVEGVWIVAAVAVALLVGRWRR